MKSKLLAACAIAAALALPAIAQDQVTQTPATLEQIQLAETLARYGEARQDPVLLLAAARIARNIEPEGPASKGALPTMDTILSQAAQFAQGNQYILSEIETLRAPTQSKVYCYGPYGVGWC